MDGVFLNQLKNTMHKFIKYKRKGIGELRPYIKGMPIDFVSISNEDRDNGSPKEGDMIARNPENHDDQWLVSAKYFKDNFEDSIPLPIGNTVKLIKDAEMGKKSGQIKTITGHILFDGENGYRLDDEKDSIYLMEDFE